MIYLPAYHLWHLVGTYNYLSYSGDTAFVAKYWPHFVKGLNRTLSLLSSNGIVNVTGDQDWGRFTYGTERASASMLFVSIFLSFQLKLACY
jgi:hypothetical protein